MFYRYAPRMGLGYIYEVYIYVPPTKGKNNKKGVFWRADLTTEKLIFIMVNICSVICVCSHCVRLLQKYSV